MNNQSRVVFLFFLTFFISLISIYFTHTVLYKLFDVVCNTAYSIPLALLTLPALYYVFKPLNPLSSISLGFIFAGGVFNLIEYSIFRCVNDYFNFLNLFRFNLADLFIFIGVVLFLLVVNLKLPK